MRRFSAMTLAIAIAASFAAPFAASAQCHPVPDEVCGEIPAFPPCPLPRDTPNPDTWDQVCGTWGKPDAPTDSNVLALPDKTYTPSDVTVRMGRDVVFQNMSTDRHTVTYVGCTDGADSTPCLFNVLLDRGQRLFSARAVNISSAYEVDGKYDYYCQFIEGMGGSFTVAAR